MVGLDNLFDIFGIGIGIFDIFDNIDILYINGLPLILSIISVGILDIFGIPF